MHLLDGRKLEDQDLFGSHISTRAAIFRSASSVFEPNLHLFLRHAQKLGDLDALLERFVLAVLKLDFQVIQLASVVQFSGRSPYFAYK